MPKDVTDTNEQKKFFIFPLTNINLFPNTTKPLHVFEPRYIEMINQSIEKGIPIALCFVPEGTSEIRPIAGYAIPQIIERRLDQTLLVFMAGQGKVKLDLKTIQTLDLVSSMHGTVVTEDFALDQTLKDKYMALSEVLVRWITRHISDPMQRDVFIKNLTGPKEVIGAFSAYLIYDYDLQYEAMELTSLRDQIQFLYRLLESGKLTNL
ncbi:MAG: ATP-dependent protease La [Pseudobdellovibrio sp.]|nr:ATP-dependent protease La [Pseudobdellovibrio sp.]